MLRNISIFLLILTASIASIATAATANLKVSLDSAYLLMGRITPLHIELTKDAAQNGAIIIPSDSMCGNVEILRMLKADTADLGNGRIGISQDIILQSFDSGVYRLNPIMYIAGSDTLRSNRVVLKVLPADVDTLQTIHDYTDVADIDRNFIDYLPDFIVDYGLWILAVIIVLAIGGYILYIVRKKKNPFATPAPKPVPPYEKAISELNELRAGKLCENGHEKEFYTRLTDILRVYLYGRFGVNAMEMTSSQIRHAVHSNKEACISKENMERVLEIADFVKFAKMRPLPDDNVKAFESALRFVTDTKPQPVPEEIKEDNIANSDGSNTPSTVDVNKQNNK